MGGVFFLGDQVAPTRVTRTLRLANSTASSRLNVASQDGDASSLLACYRRLLELRRGSNALSVGRLELGDLTRNSDDVLYYRRIYEHGGAREVAHVALKFSGHEPTFDLATPVADLLRSLDRIRAQSLTPGLCPRLEAPSARMYCRALR